MSCVSKAPSQFWKPLKIRQVINEHIPCKKTDHMEGRVQDVTSVAEEQTIGGFWGSSDCSIRHQERKGGCAIWWSVITWVEGKPSGRKRGIGRSGGSPLRMESANVEGANWVEVGRDCR